MGFINKNMNFIIKVILPIIIIALIISMVPLIMGAILCLLIVKFIINKFNIKKMKFFKSKVKGRNCRENNGGYESKVIDVDYEEV